MKRKFFWTAVLSLFLAWLTDLTQYHGFSVFFFVLAGIAAVSLFLTVWIEKKHPEVPLEHEFKNLEVGEDGNLTSDKKPLKL